MIILFTSINAPIQRCFDLARSIDLHVGSIAQTRERAIGGVTTGLIELDQEVEWRARHFGIRFSMRVRITAFDAPTSFRDEMVTGPFRSFLHDHSFHDQGSSTLMLDRVAYWLPLAGLGRTLDKLFVRSHLQRLLEIRNEFLKSVAESDQWRNYLPRTS